MPGALEEQAEGGAGDAAADDEHTPMLMNGVSHMNTVSLGYVC